MTNIHTGARRRTTQLLVACGVIGGATVLGLASAGGTLAALSASQTIPGATLTAGSLDLTLNGASTVTLDEFSVLPGAPQVAPVTVENIGTTPMGLTTTIAVSTSAAINDHFTARVTPVPSATTCVPGLAGAADTLDGFAASEFADVDPGESIVVCLELMLDEATPVALSGQSASFTATVTGSQKAR
ncbi:hypothetical protein [Lysinibacter cavernae]|uniref:Uncharacterized protein n=1 Tax=Lysinibacter cavernae TaxID=1640652 RepID=A0A7X5QZU0_9MICO|nr:hypothetical protein [Lysinibacter cavernae]NIH52976.1 hypothetical protein [Lysinibacter cavernae]